MSNLILPHDITAESGVIASLILTPELMLSYEHLKPKNFYNREYQAMYWAITELYKNGIETIDKYNLVTKLSENKGTQRYIDSVGGDKFIDTQIENAPFLARYSHDEYKMIARKVLECGFRRDAIHHMDRFKGQLYNTETNLNQLNSNIITSFDSLAERFVAGENVTLFADRIDDIIRELEEDQKRSSDGIVGMRPKWEILSDAIRYEDGDLYVYAARRKAGKSLLLLAEGIDKASKGLSVIMTSSEMSDKKEIPRMLSMISGIPIDDIKAGNFDGHTNGRQRYHDAQHFLKNAKFTREYNTNWDRDNLQIKLKAMKHKLGGCDIIIHDYIKDVESSDSSTKYNELGKWADFLKNRIAGEFDVPVLTAVQLNRNYQIADSDNIERYASVGIKWVQKTREEVLEDGVDCGNHKMEIFFSRDGGTHEEGDYYDFFLDTRKEKTNLRIIESREQHEDQMPDFMTEEE